MKDCGTKKNIATVYTVQAARPGEEFSSWTRTFKPDIVRSSIETIEKNGWRCRVYKSYQVINEHIYEIYETGSKTENERDFGK